jgi:hypothetical protein
MGSDQHIAAGGPMLPAPLPAPLLLIGLFGLFVFVLISLAPGIADDGDIGWHIATGRLIAATGAVPGTDPFSLTFAGRPWTAHEWLSDLMMAGADAAGGWTGLALLTGAAVATALMLMGLEIGRWLNGPRTLIVLLLALAVLKPFIFARPHVLAWVPLAGWAIILLRAREAGRAPPLAAALIMLVWANLHGSFLFGLALTGAFGLEALILSADRARALRQWGVFGLVTLAAALATPSGAGGLLFPLQVSGLAVKGVIVEWLPTVLADMPGLQAFLFIGLGTLLWRGVRVPPLRLLMLGGVAWMAFDSARHQALLAILGSLIIAAPLGASFPAEAPARPGGGTSRRALLLLAGAALLFAGLRLATPQPRATSPFNPDALIAALPPDLRQQPVFNGYNLGGTLIMAGIRPFIDGRADIYGDDFVLAHRAMVDGDKAAFDAAAARWGITWTMLPATAALTAQLDTDPRWQRLAADPWTVVHVRRSDVGANAPSPPPV